MALNFGILQPVNIGGNIMAGRQEAQRNELAQQQLAANQQQMQTGAMQQEKMQLEMADFKAKQAGLDKFLAMSAANGKTGSPEELASSFYDFALTQRDPQLILTAQTMRQAATERSAYNASRQPPKISPVGPAAGALGSGTFDPNAPIAAPMPTMAQRSATATGTNLPPIGATNQLAPPPVNQLGVDTTALENEINDLRTNYRNVPELQKRADRLEKQLEESRKLYTVDGNLVTATGKSVFTADKKAAAPPAMVAEYEFAKTPAGGNFTGSYQQFVTARAAAGRAPAQPPQPQPPVAVVGPDGKQIYVTREEALSKRMTPAAAMEGLAPKEIQAREAKFPAATSAVKTFESSAEKLAADLEKLSTHPGLSGISGLVYGRTPAVTKDARAAQALYDSILARGGFQELQNMRAASPTGGALGNVSNQEGQYLRDAFGALSRTQDTADLSRALRETAGATRSSKQRLREAYNMTYDYKSQGGATAPAAGGKVVDFGSLK